MLPFLAGLVAGVAGVVAIQNRKEIKEKMIEGASKVQEVAKDVTDKVINKPEKEKPKEEIKKDKE